MTRFIPIILASAIFFACGSEAQNQNEEKATTPIEMADKKAMSEQPTAVTVAQQEEEMDMNEHEGEMEKDAMEDASMKEKGNAKPLVEEKITVEKEEVKANEKMNDEAEIAHEEGIDKMPEKKDKMMDKQEEKEEMTVTKIEEKEMSEPQVKVETPKKEELPKKMIPTHQNWDQLVRKYISSTGKVNYKGFKADKAKLDAYLQELANNPPQSDWKRNEAMAYWINAYNANTIKLIVDNYPVKSIMDLYGGKAFDRKWIKIGDKTYSLNNIENDILRPRYKDARIHFAVNCAAMSCPPIHNRAWTAANLNGTLQAKAKSFVNNAQYNEISKGSVEISKIFEWYAGDFGNIVDYLNKYAATEIKDNAKVSYKEYNWELNQ
ncbi:MAG: DUF547 domain-containing protein [Bacteroidota bacterium]